MPYYTTDTTRIAYETFDTEVVLVDLDTGHYYVLAGTAGTLWRLFLAGLAPQAIGDLLTTRYTGSARELADAAQEFAHELVDDGLLSAVDQAPAPLDTAILAEFATAVPNKAAFDSPAMFKYTEMENLIQMDPIREVDESGWPQQRRFPKKAP